MLIVLLMFLSVALCREATALKPECLEPSYEGQYLSLHVFWSYSPTLGRCTQRTFGGPAPSGRNHFDSLLDCQEACED
ncbi:uncharacterized protein LOC128182911 [Crassostrea angulata]|uniref:uncharacterized protein LOC128182911 n=1 Tax=Magallana angulata TaxID=2784310 RepID=UPI0022B1C309|nr:uncharacterized protein LOC128182911 [Crassostrea angulata]